MALAMRRRSSAVLILAVNVSPFSMPRSWTQARLSSGCPGEPSITFGGHRSAALFFGEQGLQSKV